MKSTIQKLLVRLARMHPKNHKHGREAYPQLWYVLPNNRIIKWLCKHLIGHEPSQTERGYAGGRFEDRWCRWCNQHMILPVAETEDFPDSWGDIPDQINRQLPPST